MPLDPVVVDMFRLFKVYLHQMTPSSIVRLNLYMWLAKTCRLSPSAEGFARAFRVHYQPKKISVQSAGGAEISAIPQYGCYTFAFHKNLPCPVAASKNKWANDWSSYWFYHKVTLDPITKTFSTRDVIEEIVACGCFPVRVGWDISSWLAEDHWIEGILVPDFAAVFSLRADRKFSCLGSS